jgi:hypothetical protein
MKRVSRRIALCAVILIVTVMVPHMAPLSSSRATLAHANQPSNPQTALAKRWDLLRVALGQPTNGNEPAKLISRGSILDDKGPLSFPQKIVSGPSRTLYLLDTELSNVFLVNSATSAVTRLCSPRLPVRPSDASVDNSGNVWILDQQAQRVTSFDQQCRVRTSFKLERYATRVQLNAFGEVVMLTPNARTLFDIYSADGKSLRSFGEKFDYQDPFADVVLNSGPMLPDRTGGFYFSFTYPPLLRHYARDGRLLAEFKPELNVPIERPQFSRIQGVSISINTKYQIGVLDLALDSRGRLVLLVSGENQTQAMRNGSRNLLVTNARGQTLAKFELDAGPFNRLAAGSGLLYLLRNRTPLRLDKFALP